MLKREGCVGFVWSLLLVLGGCASSQGGEGAGCFPNNTCSKDSNGAWLLCQEGTCVKPACPQGEVGCGCFPGGTCADGLYCGTSTGAPRCELPNCNVGDANCGCRPDRTCNAASDGSALVCDGRICVAATCTQGAANCACRADYSCNAGLACSSAGKCVAPTCNAGELGCGCLPTGTCTGSTLFCAADGKCQAQTCNQGEEGCGCFSDFSCKPGANNAVMVCASGKCVKRSCTAGQADCPCRPDGTCDTGACRNGFCLAGDSVNPPANPVCYTPCQSGLAEADGGFTNCDSSGLMARCLDGRSCTQGSCVADGGMVPQCMAETDCPDFQTCIQGRCYSNCSAHSDCAGSRRCYRHVCRATCTSASDTCPTGQACSMVDGTTGYCTPVPATAAGAPTQTEVLGTFAVSTDALQFSNTALSGSVTLTNNAPQSLEFIVEKLDHVELSTTGNTITTNALNWLTMGANTPSAQQTFRVIVSGNGGTATLSFGNAANMTLTRWQGRVRVSNDKLGDRIINLTYASRPDGRWAGKVHYFANFRDTGLTSWTNDKENVTLLGLVQNSFVQRWGAFRRGAIEWDEMQAIITATLSESWKWQSTQDICMGGEACYLYSRMPGYGVYSTSLDTYPIPTASSELPIALDLRAPNAMMPQMLSGKIATSESLHYAGDPTISMAFEADPGSCRAGNTTTCLAVLTSLNASIFVGGRYQTTKADTGCSAAPMGSFTQASVPWLLPDFQKGTEVDTTGLRYRYECRDNRLPGADAARNVSFAQSNPIPDGKIRRRRIELVDGALINQDTLMVIFREKFESFLGTSDLEGFSAYGFMLLKRTPAELPAAAFVGNTPPATLPEPPSALGLSCDPAIVTKILGTGQSLNSTNATTVALGVLDGVKPTGAPTEIDLVADPTERVHYLCHTNGLFNGGPRDDGTPAGTKVACPAGSTVTFFTTSTALTQAQVAALSCQQNGSCQTQLDQWRANNSYSIRLNPAWRCQDENKIFCDTNRLDLRAAKRFYKDLPTAPVFVPILTAIDNAFRYKTQFRGRQGTSLGFTPQKCVPNSNAIPYCYDPPAIEELRERVECALDLFTNYYGSLSVTPVDVRTRLKDFLTAGFSYSEDLAVTPPDVYDGFEKLNAELVIMLGDEAYTKAFASRFDLANSQIRSFEGSKFEPNGINLAGGAGNEMYNLYLATQYYQDALDRFYRVSPYLWQSISNGSLRNFVGLRTVVTYFDRLIRASTQKSRAWSEVAKRYQTFNRPDLARSVVERGYAAAYMESIILSRMMLKVVQVSQAADRAQIVNKVEFSALSYRAALLDMRDVYRSLTDSATYFGYAPDFIPIPALNPGEVNVFTKLLAIAQQSSQIAAGQETAALQGNRSYETDSAQFQSELVKIRTNYEGQLAELCGSFTGSDQRIYPATRAYAQLNPQVALLGDPCGRTGTGALHSAIGQIEIVALELRSISQQYSDVLGEVEIERQRVNAQCGLNLQLANYRYGVQGQTLTLQDSVRNAQTVKGAIDRAASTATSAISQGIPWGFAVAAIGAANVVAQAVLDSQIGATESRIGQIQREAAYWETTQQCTVMRVDSDARTKTVLLRLSSLELEALKAQYRLQLAVSDVQRLQNQATRLLAEQEEIQQQTISVAAAQNDPNVRIYKNDAIISSDRTFNQAIRDAYLATKAFEYYTSQSYARLQNLFLVRMVAHGTYDLQGYLQDLQNEYASFQQQFGNPDTRVEVISVRDDVLRIPRTGMSGRALTQAERTDLFRQKMADTSLLDDSGYLTMPFETVFAALSPLTRNHKIKHIEAEFVGSANGDSVGRLYIRQRGTSAVRSVGNGATFYRLPERTAVVNTFFNGVRVFTPEVYQSDRLRDRPFLNSRWEVVLNQKDEVANKDINLQALTDIKVYVYYTDFTL